jgi:hypothetical protein
MAWCLSSWVTVAAQRWLPASSDDSSFSNTIISNLPIFQPCVVAIALA